MHLFQQYSYVKQYLRYLHLLEQTHAEELVATLLLNKAAAFGAVRQQLMEQPHYLRVLQQMHAQKLQERQQRKQRLAQEQQSARLQQAAPVPVVNFLKRRRDTTRPDVVEAQARFDPRRKGCDLGSPKRKGCEGSPAGRAMPCHVATNCAGRPCGGSRAA